MATKKTDLIIAITSFLMFVASVLMLGYTGRDDSHITYFVSDALAAGRGIVNYSGDYIEQSSSLAFSILLAFPVSITGIKAATVGPLFGFMFYLAAIILTGCILRWRGGSPCFAFVVALCPPALYWALSGMEGSLYILELLIAAYLAARYLKEGDSKQLVFIAMVATLAAVTRPEAVIVISCFAVGIFLVCRFEQRALKVLLVVLTVATIAIGLRIVFDLGVFPISVYAKQHLSFYERIVSGTHYFGKTFLEMPLTSLLLFLLSPYVLRLLFRNFIAQDRDIFNLCLALLIIAVACFAFFAGGDWMEAGRFLAPAVFFAFLLVVILAAPPVRKYIAIALVTSSMADIAILVRQDFGGVPWFSGYSYSALHYEPSRFEFQNVIHIRDIGFTDRFLGVLKQDPRQELVIASTQAGYIPYYLVQNIEKKITFVDLFGLTSNEVHKCSDNIWGESDIAPYEFGITNVEECTGRKFDYVYDIDTPNWWKLRRIQLLGCRIVFREHLKISLTSWKKAKESYQFVARCR